MNLAEANIGEEYTVKAIATDDEELEAFLFSLGCYSGEPITVVSHIKGGCVVSIKDARYNIDTVDNIYISGDGAKWIKEGVNWIPKSVFVLDYFHLSKYIKTATAHMEYTSRYMWQYLKLNMKKDVNALFKAIIESTAEPSKKDAVITAKNML